MIDAAPEQTKITVRLPDQLDRGLEDLLGTGLYLNRSDVLRTAARVIPLEEPPFRDYRGEYGEVNGQRYATRIPQPLAEKLEDLDDADRLTSRGAGVRVGLAVLAERELSRFDLRTDCAVPAKEVAPL